MRKSLIAVAITLFVAFTGAAAQVSSMVTLEEDATASFAPAVR
jgi:hypothetical protein